MAAEELLEGVADGDRIPPWRLVVGARRRNVAYRRIETMPMSRDVAGLGEPGVDLAAIVDSDDEGDLVAVADDLQGAKGLGTAGEEPAGVDMGRQGRPWADLPSPVGEEALTDQSG